MPTQNTITPEMLKELWCRCDTWLLEDAIALVLDRLPTSYQKREPERDEPFEILHALAINCLGYSLRKTTNSTDNAIRVEPVEFIQWVEDYVPIPDQLKHALNDKQVEPDEGTDVTIAKQRRIATRALAAYFWSLDKDKTLHDMASDPAILKFGCFNKNLAERTIIDWIRSLNPNPQPGRRPKKQG